MPRSRRLDLARLVNEGTIELAGAKLWYRRGGEGPTVIQLHGLGYGHADFELVTERMAGTFDVVDYDQRGFGRSERPEQAYGLDVWADDLLAVQDELGLGATHIHATSMGSMVAIRFAARYPDRVRSLVLNASAARFGAAGDLMLKNWIDIVREQGLESPLLAELLAWEGFSSSYLERDEAKAEVAEIPRLLSEGTTPEVFRAGTEAMLAMDLRPDLAQITAPTLVIGGDRDIMTPWDQGPSGAGQQAVHEGIAGSEKHVAKGSGHFNLFELPEDYIERVSEFTLARER